MLMTERIAQIIEEMLNSQDGIAEIRRNEFANTVGCVPSQINYVITSRFNKERGYIVESRRGGGGYIKIIRPQRSGSSYLYHLLATIGDSIDSESAVFLARDMYEKGMITEREARILISVLGSRTSFGQPAVTECRNRAEMFKGIVLTIIGVQ